MSDNTPELYEIFDKCGLIAGNLLTSRQSMTTTMTVLRGRLAQELNAYIQSKAIEPISERTGT